MLIKRTSQSSGITREMDLPITQVQLDAWENGMLAQRAFPQLTPDQREFIITGMTREEFDELFKDEDEEAENEMYYDHLSDD